MNVCNINIVKQRRRKKGRGVNSSPPQISWVLRGLEAEIPTWEKSNPCREGEKGQTLLRKYFLPPPPPKVKQNGNRKCLFG